MQWAERERKVCVCVGGGCKKQPVRPLTFFAKQHRQVLANVPHGRLSRACDVLVGQPGQVVLLWVRFQGKLHQRCVPRRGGQGSLAGRLGGGLSVPSRSFGLVGFGRAALGDHVPSKLQGRDPGILSAQAAVPCRARAGFIANGAQKEGGKAPGWTCWTYVGTGFNVAR